MGDFLKKTLNPWMPYLKPTFRVIVVISIGRLLEPILVAAYKYLTQ